MPLDIDPVDIDPVRIRRAAASGKAATPNRAGTHGRLGYDPIDHDCIDDRIPSANDHAIRSLDAKSCESKLDHVHGWRIRFRPK
jgi:hypothetical protein